MAQKKQSNSGQKPEQKKQGAPPETGKTATRRLTLLLTALALLVYANTLRNGFALDDYLVLKDNTFVKSGFAGIPDILSTPYHRGFIITQSSNDLYRPLSLVSFAIEYQLFGLNPAVNHLVNILLFAGCVVLLFRFLRELFGAENELMAFIASALFALHPIHTEVVANIKSRDELMSFVFAFLCLGSFLRYAGTGKASALLSGSLWYLLAFLSKETVVTFLAVAPLIFFFYRNEHRMRSLYIMLGVAAVVVLCLLIRFSVLNAYHANNLTEISFIDNALAKKDLSFESRIATAVLMLGYYLKMLLLPYPLISDYSFDSVPFTHFSNPLVLLTMAIYAAMLVVAIRGIMSRKKDPVTFALWFFLVTIALFSNIPFLIGATMGERFLFFPSVGFCLAAAYFLSRFKGVAGADMMRALRKPVLAAILIPVALLYSGITIARNADWKDNFTLYKADLEKSPDNARLYFFVGNEVTSSVYDAETDPAKKKEMLAEGIRDLRRAVEIYPDYAVAHVELGRTFYMAAQYDSAEAHEQRAITLDPANVDARNKLGAVYLIRQEYDRAISLYTSVLDGHPDNVFAHFNLGVCEANKKNFDKALAEFRIVLRLDPTYENYKAAGYSAIIYKMANKMDSAKKYGDMIQQHDPGFRY